MTDLDALEQEIRSAFLDHEHRPNRYYFDDRSRLGNEPVGGYGYRDDLLAQDAITLIRRVHALEGALRDIATGDVPDRYEDYAAQMQDMAADALKAGSS